MVMTTPALMMKVMSSVINELTEIRISLLVSDKFHIGLCPIRRVR